MQRVGDVWMNAVGASSVRAPKALGLSTVGASRKRRRSDRCRGTSDKAAKNTAKIQQSKVFYVDFWYFGDACGMPVFLHERTTEYD